MEPKLSEGADVDQLKAETTELLGNEWTLDSDQMGFEKTFYFPNFTKTLVRSLSIFPWIFSGFWIRDT